VIRTTVPALADAGDILIAVAGHHVARVKWDRRCQWAEIRCHVVPESCWAVVQQRWKPLCLVCDGHSKMRCSAALVLDRSGSK
jgi:hypothetical protein